MKDKPYKLKKNMSTITNFIITTIVFLISLSFHEFCHALTAYLLGDDTAKKAGRLTLNPLKHIDPLGFISIFLIKIGWAKPVPFNPENFKYPRFYSVLVGIAGPLSNFLLAFISLLTLKYLPLNFLSDFAPIWHNFLLSSVWINAALGVFNLIPLPPLDGGHFIIALLPQGLKYWVYRFELIQLILLLVLFKIPAFQNFFTKAIESVVTFLSNLIQF